MKTYKNKEGVYVSERPEIFEVGKDYFNNPIYNNDLVYYFSDYYDNVYKLKKDFDGYSKNHFTNTVKIYEHQIPQLLTFLCRLVSNQPFDISKNIPKVDDIVILKSHNYKFKVLDNTGKLFIRVQSLLNPDYITIFGLYELK